MSLDFDNASVDVVSLGSAASLDNLATGTILIWTNPDTLAGDHTLAAKYSGGTGWTWQIPGVDTTDHRFTLRRATDDLNINSKGSSQAITTGNWNYLGVTWDIAGANGDQKLFYGSLIAAATEADNYTTQLVGSGAADDESALSLGIGNTVAAAAAEAWDGKIAWVGIWNRQLSLGEIKAQQFHPHVTSGCISFIHLGFNGVGTQPDWSGNGNSGAVTGAVVAVHVPFGPLWGFDITSSFGAAAPPVGNAGIMTTNTGYWGPTF